MRPKLLIHLCIAISCTSISHVFAQSAVLTFQLAPDSIARFKKDTLLNIGIRGNMAPLTWVKGVKMTDVDKEGVYSATVAFNIESETDLYFKYVLNDVEWEAGDARRIRLSPDTQKVVASNFRYVDRPGNPFEKFIGEWTLKDDNWEQDNGNGIKKMKIPNHYTIVKEVNTDTSILQIVDATSAKGHILWVYNHTKKEIEHVSSFYPFRSGSGKGYFDEKGNVHLKVEFEGEPDGTYRIYEYYWLNTNEYSLSSIQYDQNGTPTRNYYGGIFIRTDLEHTER
ncbi:MAG: hypothetical protein WBB27_13650 [Maribacter sp.]